MVCVWLSFAAGARAQSVALDMSACGEVPPREVRSVLAVELQEQLVGEAEAVPAGAMRVDVRCERGTADVSLRGTTSRRALALESVPPELRARLLALSVAELTRPQPLAAGGRVEEQGAARAEDPRGVGETSSAAAGTAEPSAAVIEDTSAPDTSVAWGKPARFLWAGVEAHAAPLTNVGGDVSFRVRVAQRVAWASALSGSYARTDIDRGELQVLSLSLRIGAAWLVESSRASFHVGAGVRGRWQRLTGKPRDDASTAAAHFEAWSVGAALFAGATWRVAEPVFLALELEADHMLREVRAKVEEGRAKTLSPWRASATLGAGVAW